MSSEFLYFLLTALVSSASAYGSLKARLSAVEKRLETLASEIRLLRP